MKQMNSLVLGEIKSKILNTIVSTLLCCLVVVLSCSTSCAGVGGIESISIPVNVVTGSDSLNVKPAAEIFEVIMKDKSRTKVLWVTQRNEGPKEFSIDRTRIEVQVNGSNINTFSFRKRGSLLDAYSDWLIKDSNYVIRPNEGLFIEVEANVSVGDSIRIVERNVQAERDSLVLEMVVP